MIETPSNPESRRSYLLKFIHTRIIIYPLNIKIDFEKNFQDFFLSKIKFVDCYI